ncbi:unnamed protein product [Penicillium manginii]
MLNVLVTGAARGLGLELVKRYSLQLPDNGLVIATSRKSSPDLEELVCDCKSKVFFVEMDISSEESILQSVETVKSLLPGKALDILINNAGVHSWTNGGISEMSDLAYQLSINVTGTHNVIKSYLPLLQAGNTKKVINISSPWGSTTSARSFLYAPCPAYKISKAALNSLTVQYALFYEADGFIFLCVNPGWLRTEMGGSDGDLSAEEGANAVTGIISSASQGSNGRFKTICLPGYEQYDGKDVLW